MASSQLISLPNALSVSSLLTIVRGAFQRESCCASALSGESIKAKRLHLIYNRGSRFHQIVGPYASLFLAKGQDRCDKLRQKPTFCNIKLLQLAKRLKRKLLVSLRAIARLWKKVLHANTSTMHFASNTIAKIKSNTVYAQGAEDDL